MIKMLRAMAAAGLITAALPAAAQTLLLDLNTNVPLAATLDNPCTPEVEAIAFSGMTQLMQRVWLMPTGTLRLQFAENTSLTGTDAVGGLLGGAGKTYTVSGGGAKDYEFTPEGFAILRFKKVGGTTDNFYSVLVMAFDPQNLGLQLGLEAACESGMP